METVELIKTIAALITSSGVIFGGILAVVKWFQKQDKQTTDIESLRHQHEQDIRAIKDELCVQSYGMLAALDGLMQLHCNGNVTKAHEKLEKHLNQKAHDQ